MALPIALTARYPDVPPATLIADMVPPPRFSNSRFSTYHHDEAHPSQAEAVHILRGFAMAIKGKHSTASVTKSKDAKKRSPLGHKTGVYLDGAYGVGKTHLHASTWQTAGGSRSFGTFSEYRNLIEALGMKSTVEALERNSLVCIDEFELDEPDDTKLVASMMSKLAHRGVKLAAASAMLPAEEPRTEQYDGAVFLAGIKGLARRFDVIRIGGGDYEDRHQRRAPWPMTDHAVREAATQITASLDVFAHLIAHLATFDPTQYAALLNGVRTVCLLKVETIEDEADALRFIVFVDRLYDRNLNFAASGVSVSKVFSPELLAGQYGLKCRRAVARLIELAAAAK